MTPRSRRASSRRRASLAAALCLLLVPAACTVNEATTPTSMVPLIPPDQLPITTLAATTTTAPSSDPDDPLLVALPQGDCAYADAPTEGELTFVFGNRLFGTTFDAATVRCLAELEPTQRGAMRWSPVANRALLNPGTVFDVGGIRSSGFDPATTRLVWEYPVGDALIAPTPSSKTLVRRSATDGGQRTEITFLPRTWLVASHPSGQALLAVGRTADDVTGLFAAGPTGQDGRPLLFIAGDRTVQELAIDPSGRSTYLISTRGDSFSLHRLSLTDLVLSEVSSTPTPLLQVTPGPTASAVAWKSGLCNSITDTWVFDERIGSAVVAGVGTPLEGLSVAPLGWLDATRLVVTARTLGCDGPADVWTWNLLDGSATLLVKSIELPALRQLQPQATMPVIDPVAAPPAL
jgi:hypothetical protein